MKNEETYLKYIKDFGNNAVALKNQMSLESKVKTTSVFDYFKFAVYYPWKDRDPEAVSYKAKLFECLGLDVRAFDVRAGDKNFDSKLLYNGDTIVLYGARGNLPKGVNDYYMVEMTGSACRSFELRGGSWLSLFELVNSVSHKVTRIDLANDDFSGIVPLEDKDGVMGLKTRCELMYFVSNFRQRKSVRVGKLLYGIEGVDDGAFGDGNIQDDPKGWSVTFGKVDCIQLQIYDKNKERLARGVHTNLDSWVRFEMRFGSIGDRAETAFRLSYLALQNKCFGVLNCQLLRWLIDFKEVPYKEYSRSKYDRLPSWKPYDDFLGGVESNHMAINQGRVEATVTTSVSWIMNQWAKTCVMLCKVSQKYFLAVLANSMVRYLEHHHEDDNAIEGQVKTFFLMFPKELGKYDKDTSKQELLDFIHTYSDGSVQDDTQNGNTGVFAWNKY